MAAKSDNEFSRLDEAARAGWLYYVAGNTQDEIARKLGVSRQSAQRLVSLAVSERLIKVRVDHPIAKCMVGIAQAGAAEMERHLKSSQPKIIAIGTGRALRACVEQLPAMDCPQHRIVSLLGNMMSDGSATAYNVIIRMADRVNARHFPMPLPVFATTPEERKLLHGQEPVRNILELARQADVTFVGIGQMNESAQLVVDGFVTRDEAKSLNQMGAIGEITSWVYDKDGKLIDGHINDRVASAPLHADQNHPVFGIAVGEPKVPAIRGALRGRLINALITNEATAELLLNH